jgi:hypothetical protein
MQNLPDRDVLLQAVAGFLMRDVVPAIDDRGTAFRVRIAAHLVATVSRELQSEEADDAAQIGRLAAVLGAGEGGASGSAHSRAARHAIVRELELAVVAAARAADPDSDSALVLRRAVQADLAARLRVVNPRFDRAVDVEG